MSTEVVKCFDSTNTAMLELYHQFGAHFHADNAPRRSGSHVNAHTREHLHRKFQHYAEAKYGGEDMATKKLLYRLPCSAQSRSSSPLLDQVGNRAVCCVFLPVSLIPLCLRAQTLFRFDGDVVDSESRPRASGYPLRFYSQRGGGGGAGGGGGGGGKGELMFTLDPRDVPERDDSAGMARLQFASYAFHPVLPFAISTLHLSHYAQVVNIHHREQAV